MIGQWRIGRTIGKGSSGRVKIAKHAVTGKYAAIKIVPKGLILTSRMSMSEAGAKADKVLLGIEREIVIMKLIDHPNVLNLYDVWETSGELFLIMEYVPGGELFDYLVKRGRLPENEALRYFQQIIHAVDYCHRFNICHRDLKPENLLLDKDKNIKVADFGMAAWQAGERMLETSCGSPHYASPEIVAGKAYHGSASDIWSCGIILFALITGRLPFDDDNIRVLLLKVKTGIFEMPNEVQGHARDLLYRMLEKDPERRITMPDILVHPFFTSVPLEEIPGRPLVPPPALGEVERPVGSAAEIDSDIMGNLKTLWHGASDETIIEALLSSEQTWEKAIYHLLIKYRNRHLENYDAEDSTHGLKSPLMANSAASKENRNPLHENSTARASLNRGEDVKSLARPEAPTPTKALAQAQPVAAPRNNYGPSVQDRMARLNVRPVPQGPRPPMSPRGSTQSTYSSERRILSEIKPDAVPIRLEEPITANRENEVVLAPMVQQVPVVAPVVEDTDVQRFFEEVAQQLNVLGGRSSLGSEKSQAPTLTINVDAQRSGQSERSDDSRFDDAEDDESEYAIPYTPMTEHDTFSIHSSMMTPLTPAPMADSWGIPGMEMMQSDMGRRASVRSSGTANRRRSQPWTPSSEKEMISEDAHLVPHRQAPVPPPRAVAAANPSIPRDGSYVLIQPDEDLQGYDRNASQSSRQSHGLMRKRSENFKQKKKALTIKPIPFGSASSAPNSSETPKRSWFQNLFNFKPAPYMLWSYESTSFTARVLQQNLTALRVKTATERLNDQTIIKCKFSPTQDTFDRTISKAVYFKVEIMHAMSPSSYASGARLTLMKGAESTFRELCDRIRQSYHLDNADRRLQSQYQ